MTKYSGGLASSLRLIPKERVAIYYDGDCGFCRRWAYRIRKYMLPSDTQVVTAQTNPEIWKEMQKYDSWVIVNESGEHFYTFKAGVENCATFGMALHFNSTDIPTWGVFDR